MGKIKIGIIGIGNCASALVQGIEYYRDSNKRGLLRPNLAGYNITDIQVVAAVDISEDKVGKPISEAIKANELDVVVDFHKNFNVLVVMGDILDGVNSETEKSVKPANQTPINVAKYFKSTGVEIVLCLLPFGADNAVKFYANEAIKAGCAFINATPTNVATDNYMNIFLKNHLKIFKPNY